KTFLYKPALKMLDERKAGIEEALDKADAARLEVAATNDTIRANLTQARHEAQALIDEAKNRAEEVKTELILSAKNEAAALTEQARVKIEQEKLQAIAELKNQLAELTVLLAEKVLSGGLTGEQEKLLMDKFIKEVGELP
ncbi:MAG: F0F1 ATP synthase subunit B, partial [Clostridiales bacterium]